MGSHRKYKWLAFGSASAIAIALSLTMGQKVIADFNLSSEFDVFIDAPVADPGTFFISVATDGAVPPSNLPIPVDSSVVQNAIARGTGSTVTSVQTVLGGTLDTGNGEITDELQAVEATEVGQVGNETFYTAVINAGLMDFEAATRGTGEQSMFASDFIRTVVIAEGYYSESRTVTGITEGAQIGLSVLVRDTAAIDGDGNNIPDATVLLEGPFPIIGLDGNGNILWIVISNDDLLRGDTGPGQLDITVPTALGDLDLFFDLPTTSELNTAGSTTYTNARTIIEIGTDPAAMLDGPDGVDPLADFDLEGPTPQGTFARINLIATDTSARGAAPPAWTSIDPLPGSLTLLLEASGEAIEAALEDLTEVEGYTYDVELTQDLEDLTVNGAEPPVWAPVELVSLSGAAARSDTVEAGDDTILLVSTRGSAIFGSNGIPALSTGSDDDNCFIATAAFGTPLAVEIEALRGVRDQYLLTNPLGMVFADAYYKLSPSVADDVAQSGTLKQIVRTALLPVIAVSKWLLASPGTVLLTVVTLIAAAAVLRRKMRRA